MDGMVVRITVTLSTGSMPITRRRSSLMVLNKVARTTAAGSYVLVSRSAAARCSTLGDRPSPHVCSALLRTDPTRDETRSHIDSNMDANCSSARCMLFSHSCGTVVQNCMTTAIAVFDTVARPIDNASSTSILLSLICKWPDHSSPPSRLQCEQNAEKLEPRAFRAVHSGCGFVALIVVLLQKRYCVSGSGGQFDGAGNDRGLSSTMVHVDVHARWSG